MIGPNKALERTRVYVAKICDYNRFSRVASSYCGRSVPLSLNVGALFPAPITYNP